MTLMRVSSSLDNQHQDGAPLGDLVTESDAGSGLSARLLSQATDTRIFTSFRYPEAGQDLGWQSDARDAMIYKTTNYNARRGSEAAHEQAHLIFIQETPQTVIDTHRSTEVIADSGRHCFGNKKAFPKDLYQGHRQLQEQQY